MTEPVHSVKLFIRKDIYNNPGVKEVLDNFKATHETFEEDLILLNVEEATVPEIMRLEKILNLFSDKKTIDPGAEN